MLKRLLLGFLVLFLAPVALKTGLYYQETGGEFWRRGGWDSTGLLAAPGREARIVVFAAPTGGLKGALAVHSWLAVKPENATEWRRYDVFGWGMPVRTNAYAADARWRGETPRIVADISGPLAAAAIPKIEAAIRGYRYAKLGDYRVWPGPNSNTFVATALAAAPELEIALPPDAIGKDFRIDGSIFGLTASRTGIEANLFGLLGVKLAWVEGVEINLLGLVTGLDIRRPALKIPGFGRIGVTPDTATARPA